MEDSQIFKKLFQLIVIQKFIEPWLYDTFHIFPQQSLTVILLEVDVASIPLYNIIY